LEHWYIHLPARSKGSKALSMVNCFLLSPQRRFLSQKLKGLQIIWPGSLGNTNWAGSKMDVKQEDVPVLCLAKDIAGTDTPPRVYGRVARIYSPPKLHVLGLP
jgi:hypothetical protein